MVTVLERCKRHCYLIQPYLIVLFGHANWECDGATPPRDLVRKRAMCLVALLPRTGTHLCDSAVHISVFCCDNNEVWRGAEYLDMDERTPMNSICISPKEAENRRTITQIMESNGFVNCPGEFWHYNKGDALYQMLTRSGQPAIYGPVNWDTKTNYVHPFEDIDQPLVTEDCLGFLLEQALLRFEQQYT